jgi:hypothetical protein
MPDTKTKWMRYILFGVIAIVLMLGFAQFMSGPSTTSNEPASQTRKMF